MNLEIRRMNESDVEAVASVHRAAFPDERESDLWIRSNFAAYPRLQYFVAVRDSTIAGYVVWIQKCGFRQRQLLELEQIAVHPFHQRAGIGETLIRGSLPLVKEELARRNARIENILVTTSAENFARRLYEKTLGAKAVHLFKEYVNGHDELYMIARHVDEI